jgi:hypothetical protein
MALERLLLRGRIPLLVLYIAILIAAHALFLGFTSWDGLSYRVPPIVELLQHGSLGAWKFDYPPARFLFPFLELVHLPFLKLFGLPGLYFSFALVLLPLSAAAVYVFVRELGGDGRWASYSALAFLALPFVNTQPFSGYIDFAVVGELAFFLFALWRAIRQDRLSLRNLATLSLASFAFSMSRQQTPYMALLLTAVVLFWRLGPFNADKDTERWGLKGHLLRLTVVLLSLALGLVPAAFVHLGRLVTYGSPIYPYRFEAFGLSSPAGVSLQEIAGWSGQPTPGWGGMLQGFLHAWLVPDRWPRDFFDSRTLGVGLLLWLTLLTMPILGRALNRDSKFLLVAFTAITLLTRDFWLPRWSMTGVLALVLALGAALAWLGSHGPRPAWAALLLLVSLHLGRPLFDIYSLRHGVPYVRSDLAGSPLFIGEESAAGVVDIYPDLGEGFVIVRPVENGFMLPLYGRALSNRIVGVLDDPHPDARCLVQPQGESAALIIDQHRELPRAAPDCVWICAYPGEELCLAGSLRPPDS